MAWAHPVICMVASHPNDSGFASASSFSEPDWLPLTLLHLNVPKLREYVTQTIQTGFFFLIVHGGTAERQGEGWTQD